MAGAAARRKRRDPARRLAALSPGVRRELLMVLTADSHVRADLIRQLHERRGDLAGLAEVLMDLEADDLLRIQVVELLQRTL